MLISAAVVLSSVVVPGVASAAPATGVLASGATLTANQSVRSANGRYSLIHQSDGNLVFYAGPGKPVWSSQTTGKGARTVMQTDGNLVVYSAANKPVYDTSTGGNPGATLAVQDDGNLVIYSASKKALWSRSLSIGKLAAGRSLGVNESIRSANNKCHLDMQGDGNLVLYAGREALWSTKTTGKGGRKAVMQTDGNLVVVNAANQPLWDTKTGGMNGAWLAVQDDCNLVLYLPDNRVVWSPGTSR
ncbi:curculin domain-containing protein [Pseudonocardia spinosispora]|uniref:curculin domain-containing protein n=1 Tax=Pseudonocardia spinosispora TaxID=103441 RepID=UPI00146F9A00|nr:curculin domain-containing protein [Pseudonocardia spinosispora]